MAGLSAGWLLGIKVKGRVLLYRFSARVMDFSCRSVSRRTGVCGMGIKRTLSSGIRMIHIAKTFLEQTKRPLSFFILTKVIVPAQQPGQQKNIHCVPDSRWKSFITLPVSNVPSSNKPVIMVNQANPAIFNLNLFLFVNMQALRYLKKEYYNWRVVITAST